MKRTLALAVLLVFSGLSLSLALSAQSPEAPHKTATLSIPLDINLASADQLAALPGMGPEYARRIIEGRPYSAKNQLVERGILPGSEYDRIKDLIVAHHIKADPPVSHP